MNVLMLTGDKNFKPGNPRYDLQASAVERLEVVPLVRGGVWTAFKKLWDIRSSHQEFDVVTVQDPFWRGLMSLHLAWHLNARCNVQVHTDLSVYGGIKHVLIQIVLRHADSIRVVSEKIKKQVEAMGVRAKITVLPIYIDVSKFKNIVRQPHPIKTILWLGRFEDEKDPLQAVSVLERVRGSGIDAKLVMLGAGSLEASLQDKITRFDLVGQVELPGWQDPLPYLAQADVVLCTSKHESWGASIIEALAAGVLVVAPDVGIARETGAFVAPREQLAQKVIEVLPLDARGELKLKLLSKNEWVECWKESLI